MSSDFTQSTARIVAAFTRNNGLAAADLPSLIGTVNTALAGATLPEPAPKAVAVVSARASVKPDSITCMTCGRKFKSMKRHLRGEHGQTAQQYREQWGLSRDYPMVAPTYSAARSAMAKSIGLGAKGRKAKPVPLKATATPVKSAAPQAKAKVAKPHPKPSARKKVAG